MNQQLLLLNRLIKTLPGLSRQELKDLFSEGCGSNNCRALTKQVNHSFCSFHQHVYDELERREKHPTSLSVKVKPSLSAGCCLACGDRTREVFEIELDGSVVRICRACWAELEGTIETMK